MRRIVKLRFVESRARGAHARDRDMQVEVIGERARLEIREHRISELPPPRRTGCCVGEARIDIVRYDGLCLGEW